jgi:ribonuclease P protein component
MILLGKSTEAKNIKPGKCGDFLEFFRVGFVVTKKIDRRAPMRNRIRRRIRAILRTLLLNHCNLYSNHVDYVLVMLENLSGISYADLLRDMEKLFSEFRIKYDK